MNVQMEDTLLTVAAMCRQEENGYMAGDYLYQDEQDAVMTGPQHVAVDVDCRTKMVAWCYQVVEFCKFNRETTAIALSYLDRFLMTEVGRKMALMDRTVFQLASMTCFYTAVKIHEAEAMDPKLVSALSRGVYTPTQVEEMEKIILGSLQWRMNPPTTLAFVREFMSLIPSDVLNQPMRDAVYDLCKYQSELAVAGYEFITVRPSQIAFSALMNALESVQLDDQALGHLGFMIGEAIGVDCNNSLLIEIQNHLYSAVVNEPAVDGVKATTKTSTSAQKGGARSGSCQASPRSISVTP